MTNPSPGPDPHPGPLPPNVRALLGDPQFNSCMGTVLDGNPDIPPDMAGRIVEEGLKFVVACARFPDVGLAPSRIVDEGWHALILHTAMYHDLCARLGRHVHHFPGWDPTNYDPQILQRTRAMISECGYSPDAELWGHPTGNLLVTVAAKCQHAPECTIRPMPHPSPGHRLGCRSMTDDEDRREAVRRLLTQSPAETLEGLAQHHLNRTVPVHHPGQRRRRGFIVPETAD